MRVAADHLTLYTVTNLPAISEVYVVFRGSVSERTIACGPESLDARFFDQDEIPWQELAWPELGSYCGCSSANRALRISASTSAAPTQREASAARYRIRAADADWRG